MGAIEAATYPEYELGLQIFTEEQAEGFSFDVLDATKSETTPAAGKRGLGRHSSSRAC